MCCSTWSELFELMGREKKKYFVSILREFVICSLIVWQRYFRYFDLLRYKKKTNMFFVHAYIFIKDLNTSFQSHFHSNVLRMGEGGLFVEKEALTGCCRSLPLIAFHQNVLIFHSFCNHLPRSTGMWMALPILYFNILPRRIHTHIDSFVLHKSFCSYSVRLHIYNLYKCV